MGTEGLMYQFVQTLIHNSIAGSYPYHNFSHTQYVYETALIIGNNMQCTDAQQRLIAAAALWHDTGYTQTYRKHEAASCELARQHLPNFGFHIEEVEEICEMIMATRIPQSPYSLPAQVLADADLAYLGTPDAATQAQLLFAELQLVEPGLSEQQWRQRQIAFLEQHQYFTSFCKQQYEPARQAYLHRLKQEQ